MDEQILYDHHVPHEITEKILLQLPVKSLDRFKAVCKQWNATISDPSFPESHLRQSHNSLSSYLLQRSYDSVSKRVDLKNKRFRDVGDSEQYPSLGLHVLCHCDGLFLCYSTTKDYIKDYFLWHPSRQTLKRLSYQYNENLVRHHGIVYDELAEDYKVVIGHRSRVYDIFYCKSDSRITKSNKEPVWCEIETSEGVAFKRCVYWVIWPHRNELQRIKEPKFEILCFDGRTNGFKNQVELGCVDRVARYVDFYLVSSGEGLYLFPNYYTSFDVLIDEIRFMKKIGDDDDHGAWMELTVRLPSRYYCPGVIPVCRTSDNKIVILLGFRKIYLIYDGSNNSLTEIQNTVGLGFRRLFPFVENLYLL